MRAFIKFNKGVMSLPIHWRLWVMGLVAFNLVIPLFFINRLEAQVVVAAFFASALLMTGLTALTGYTRAVGLGHVLWIPMLYFLWTRLDLVPVDDVFGFWIRALMAMNAISLVIDTLDVIRYAAGNRAEMIESM